jgi:hypothetical protein
MTLRPLALLPLAALLAGCAGSAIPQVYRPPTATAPPVAAQPVQHNRLLGNSADAVGRMFGKPRLDVSEGGGRKLQFAGSSCILDVYFYAPRTGAPAVATHADARTPDGRNAEVDSCAETLRR